MTNEAAQDNAFDPETILAFTPSKEEAAGRKPLPPEKDYGTCRIEDMKVFPPSEKYPKEGVLAVLVFKFVSPNTDLILEKRVNFRRPMSKKSTLWKLMYAVFGDKMDEHQIGDLVGEEVGVYIAHAFTDDTPPITYADFLFRSKGK